MAETMPSDDITPGASSITITVTGNYWVEFMVLLQSTTGDFGLDVGVQINGAFTTPSLFTSTVIGSDFEIITVSSIAALAAGDVLTLALSSATGGTVLFGPSLNASLSAMLLGS